ncbi:hypothetical protein OIU91_40820 (plasmid) [Streptomyces sp. NBC_01456]|uniref:hypothetical protein n=1 Tax=Streptomyces sp. NBC_01456 TaxID=2975868 RepID=UPI002E36B067|nr:hypothetical protein [Streptomyces sp. NBC_01456]
MSSSRSVSAANTGAATGLLLPPADDPVWGSVPLALRQNLSVPAHGLVNPARGGLAEKSGRPLRLALSAAANMRTTGAHWHVLLIAPRSAFGGPTSDRAGRAYALLQQVVDDYLRPALAAPAKASGKAPAEQPPTAPAPASTPAAPAAVPAEPPAAPESADGFLPDPAAAPDTVSAAGPEGGAVEEAPNPLPAADEPAAAELAGDELAGALHEITERRTVLVLNSPHPDVAHTALAQHLPAGQPAVSVAGDDRASMVRALYTQLGLGRRQRRPHALGDTEDLIVAELKRAPRLIIATTAPGLRASALQLLYSLWARENFALVLIGDTNLTTLLSRSDMASLNSRVTLRHHVAPTSPDTPAPSGTTPAEQQDPRPAEPATTPAPPDTSPPADPAALAAPADDAAADPAVTGDPRTAPEPASTAHGEELADHVREIAQARAILTVTGPDATTVHTALTRTPSLPNLPAVHTGGKDRTSLVRDLFVQLGLDQRVPQPGTLWATEDLIAAELRRASRLVIVPKAHELPTAALRMLYDLWSADNFPLVLGGDDRLDDVLQRRALASLSSCVLLHHHLDPAGEDAPISTPAAALVPPAPEPGATAAPSAAGPEPATAPPTPTTPSAPDRAAGPLPATDALTAPQEQPAPGPPTPPRPPAGPPSRPPTAPRSRRPPPRWPPPPTPTSLRPPQPNRPRRPARPRPSRARPPPRSTRPAPRCPT